MDSRFRGDDDIAIVAPMHNTPTKMQALAICDHRLTLETRPLPIPKHDEVLIRVAYAGINRADLYQVQGSYAAPADASDLPGLEVAGHIAALGPNVAGWQAGAPVCTLTHGGGYAEYVTVPAALLLPAPANLSLVEAAALPEACATAAMALLHEAGLRAGERVLIHGGMSGIGHLLVQIAHALGATVFATASPQKQSALRQLGATPIAYTQDFAAQNLPVIDDGVDVILDTLGGPALAWHIKLLRKGGRLVTIACLEGSRGELPMGALLLKHLHITGTTLRGQTFENKVKIVETVRLTLWPELQKGTIRPVIDAVFPLHEAEKAHARMENRLNSGKMVLEVAA